MAIDCDGTSVNTGYRGGVIRLLEEKLNRFIYWFVYLLHHRLINHYDGQTSDPTVSECEKLPTLEFNPIPSETIKLDSLDFSTHKAYLLQLMSCDTVCT